MSGAEGGVREREADVVVVGAGAAGLWAAERAARGGRRVLLLEKTRRTGTKVLASGGTRCNLTTTLGPREAARLFGSREAERFLLAAFQALPPQAVRARFDALGVPTVTEEALEKVFPASQRAVDVRDALERAARAAGVEILLEQPVAGLEPRPGGGWTVLTQTGLCVRAARLLVCPGGASYPRTGTTGDGYGWLADLGLPIVPPVPALVPLSSPARWVKDLAGIAVQEAEARLVDAEGATVARRRRPVLFTHTGLSGPAAMDLSVHVARAGAEAGRAGRAPASFSVAIDLLPDLAREALRERFATAAVAPGAPRLARVIPELPRRLVAAVARAAGLDDDSPALARVGREGRHRLVEALKGLRVPVSGTLGLDKAEVTAGGLDLDAVDRKTMRVRGHDGLYVFGEILDVQGPIGGLNFQAAFACAELAGGAA